MASITEPPFDQWGRLREPADSAGAYLFIEKESPDDWKQPPPADAIRIWHRMPGAPDDDDTQNWTVWIQRPQLGEWLAGYVIEEWLPEGTEPEWHA